MELTREQVEQFNEQGYIYVGEVLSADQLEEAREAYMRLMGGDSSAGTPRDFGLTDAGDQKAGRILQVMNAWSLDDVFWRIASRPDIVEAASMLMDSPTVRLYSDQALYKPPKDGSRVVWHQDNGYWALEPQSAVSMWLAFDDADETNGCMQVVPGSHKEGLLEHKAPEERGELRGVDVDQSQAVPIPVPAGHAMMHHCLTLHGTRANKSERPRRAIAISYMPADTLQHGKPLKHRPLLKGAA
jgi:ectoine hydroxylase-related dioxygenase (phytanoyl-CoA dioxygenase family)